MNIDPNSWFIRRYLGIRDPRYAPQTVCDLTKKIVSTTAKYLWYAVLSVGSVFAFLFLNYKLVSHAFLGVPVIPEGTADLPLIALGAAVDLVLLIFGVAMLWITQLRPTLFPNFFECAVIHGEAEANRRTNSFIAYSDNKLGIWIFNVTKKRGLQKKRKPPTPSQPGTIKVAAKATSEYLSNVVEQIRTKTCIRITYDVPAPPPSKGTGGGDNAPASDVVEALR